jgi:dsDNA-specific endonuclease/ATPase MutS2
MPLAFLRRWLCGLSRETRKDLTSPLTNDDDDENVDTHNPFPDVVIIPFKDFLDLHSIPPSQVRDVVEDYIEEAHRRGVHSVRIIHGKGIGVQREMVRSILSRSKIVIEFADAPPDFGGWGATVARLKSERSKQ